jgi:hypothetical protein
MKLECLEFRVPTLCRITCCVFPHGKGHYEGRERADICGKLAAGDGPVTKRLQRRIVTGYGRSASFKYELVA